MRNNKIIIPLCICLAIMVSCKKEGRLMEIPEVKKLTVIAYTLSPDARFHITVNDELIGDSMANNVPVQKNMTFTSDQQHIVVKDHETRIVLLDTSIALPGVFPKFTLVSLDASPEARPQLVIGGESELPDWNINYSFYYTHELMPESVRVSICRLNQDPVDYSFTGIVDTLASMVVKKGVLASPVQLDLTGDPLLDAKPNPMVSAHAIVLKDPVTGLILPGSEINFDTQNWIYLPFWGYDPAIRNYIADLSAFDLDGSGKLYYSSMELMYY